MSGTRKIPLTKNTVAIVDDIDYERIVTMGKWTAHSMGYAYRWDRTVKPNKCLMMHRVIANTPAGLDTDHINGNKLDNRRANLRVASRSLNNLNRETRGAYVQKRGKQFSVELVVNYKKIWIGRLNSLEEANHIRENIKQQIMEVV